MLFARARARGRLLPSVGAVRAWVPRACPRPACSSTTSSSRPHPLGQLLPLLGPALLPAAPCALLLLLLSHLLRLLHPQHPPPPPVLHPPCALTGSVRAGRHRDDLSSIYSHAFATSSRSPPSTCASRSRPATPCLGLPISKAAPCAHLIMEGGVTVLLPPLPPVLRPACAPAGGVHLPGPVETI